MLCMNPFRTNDVEYGCGKCRACRVNKQRGLIARNLLESWDYDFRENWFVTLTYESPPREGVSPKAVRNFVRRMRRRYPSIRYFIASERGTRTGRPHYHGLLYGVRLDLATLDEAWDQGRTQGRRLSPERIAYACKYTVKGLDANAPALPEGENPDFARWSKSPPLGSSYLPALARTFFSGHGDAYYREHFDVFRHVRIDGEIYPLDRYMVRKLRELCGVPQHDVARDMRRMQGASYLRLVPNVIAERERRRLATSNKLLGEKRWQERNAKL